MTFEEYKNCVQYTEGEYCYANFGVYDEKEGRVVQDPKSKCVECPFSAYNLSKYYIQNPDAFVNLVKRTCKHLGIKGAVIGISGGKDSTIVAKLMTMALGVDKVIGVLMPNGVQSDIDVSKKVVEYLGIKSVTINIETAFNSILNDVRSVCKGMTDEKSEESARVNLAPRIRMSVLYAVAQSMSGDGWRVIGTTNRSENFIGWFTKYGDGAVDFEPIIDLSVTDLRKLGVALGIPREFVYKVPIDGLTNNTDEESFGFTYEQLDDFMDFSFSGNPDVDKKIINMHNNSMHKRVPNPCINLAECT